MYKEGEQVDIFGFMKPVKLWPDLFKAVTGELAAGGKYLLFG